MKIKKLKVDRNFMYTYWNDPKNLEENGGYPHTWESNEIYDEWRGLYVFSKTTEKLLEKQFDPEIITPHPNVRGDDLERIKDEGPEKEF